MMVVFGAANDTTRYIRSTMEVMRKTGHITMSPVLWWVRQSVCIYFSWSSKVSVTLSATNRRVEWWPLSLFALSWKITPLRLMTFIWQESGVSVNLQDGIAKKWAEIANSDSLIESRTIVCLLLVGLISRTEEIVEHSSLGVLAYCWFIGGPCLRRLSRLLLIVYYSNVLAQYTVDKTRFDCTLLFLHSTQVGKIYCILCKNIRVRNPQQCSTRYCAQYCRM